MKNKEQVLRYVSQNEFSDKDDWSRVLDWCRGQYGGGKAHKALQPIGESTYDGFMQWLDNGIAVGDIVRVGDMLGIVGGYSLQKAFLSAIVSDGGVLIQKKIWVKPDKLVLATDDEREAVDKLMTEQKLSFSISMSRLLKAYIPEDGDFVSIIKDKKAILGIFKGKADGRYCLHGIVERGRFVRDTEMPIEGVKIGPASKSEVGKIEEALDTSGLCWYSESKRIVETVAQRAKKGGYYWYMTERLMPESDRDVYNRRSDDRFECGNYFKDFKSCFEFCTKVKALRKEK